ncbi:hypothetical protein AB0C89_03015 [Streptomyces sp. NPDC048491]|uniref:hypothetical protein n=1 Tax=unclassified Streptomyces TaxID=2593676 RepID=UPI00342D18E4
MRLHQTLGAAAGALLLALAVPSSAHATTGDFFYKTGTGREAAISDPVSARCVNLPGTSTNSPGHSPRNFTTSTATVFLEADCEGDTYFVMKPGAKLGDKLKLSSVVFS